MMQRLWAPAVVLAIFLFTALSVLSSCKPRTHNEGALRSRQNTAQTQPTQPLKLWGRLTQAVKQNPGRSQIAGTLLGLTLLVPTAEATANHFYPNTNVEEFQRNIETIYNGLETNPAWKQKVQQATPQVLNRSQGTKIQFTLPEANATVHLESDGKGGFYTMVSQNLKEPRWVSFIRTHLYLTAFGTAATWASLLTLKDLMVNGYSQQLLKRRNQNTSSGLALTATLPSPSDDPNEENNSANELPALNPDQLSTDMQQFLQNLLSLPRGTADIVFDSIPLLNSNEALPKRDFPFSVGEEDLQVYAIRKPTPNDLSSSNSPLSAQSILQDAICFVVFRLISSEDNGTQVPDYEVSVITVKTPQADPQVLPLTIEDDFKAESTLSSAAQFSLPGGSGQFLEQLQAQTGVAETELQLLNRTLHSTLNHFMDNFSKPSK